MAKAKPATLPFASTGVGSTTHLALELFQTAAGVKFVHVPYRGAAPALTDLLGGQVQAFFADAPVLMPQITGGKVKAARRRLRPAQSDAARRADAGRAGLSRTPSSDNWYGLLAPAKTPPAVIAKLNDAFVDAINDPVVKEKLIESGAIPVADTPAEFGKFLKEELDALGQGRARQGHQGAGLTLQPADRR